MPPPQEKLRALHMEETFNGFPYFFKTLTPNGPKRCRVTGTSCCAMLREQLLPEFQERHCLETPLFMQDGTPLHISKPVIKFLHTFGADSHKQRFRKRLAPMFTGT
ncbi:hypothetical protein TNCV_1223511 [Trichonephila clavipes]|nr:hypothetical protein TNCV_1223511 [Trichonephila clavipes]